MNRFLLFILFSLAAPALFAQTQGQFEEAANEAFANEQYSGAYEYYGIALRFDSTRMDLWYRRAESAQNFTAYRLAESNYLKVLQSSRRDSFPDLLLRLGETNQSQGHYEEAVNYYQRYLEKTNLSPEQKAYAEKNMSDANWSLERIDDARDIIVSHLPEGINSSYADYAFSKFGDTIYYTSNRVDFKRDTVVPIRNLARIYRKIGNEESKVVDDLLPVSRRGKAYQHTANTAFSANHRKVYFTICDFVDNTEDIRCEIYYSRITTDGKWQNSVRLNINDSQATTTQPHLYENPISGESFLYFVSDRAGGKGGLDIYRSRMKEDGTLDTPENLSDINTAGDDVTPFFHVKTSTLYFSTDGKATFGGLDIHKSRWNGQEFGEAINLGQPINSSYNDRGFVILDEEDKAYFNSDRQDEVAIYWTDEREACCDDIYFVDSPIAIKLRVLTFNDLDKSELEGVTVSLYEIGPDGEEILVTSRENPDANDFEFDIEPGKKYVVRGTKNGFTEDMETVDLTDPLLAGETEIERKLYLRPGILLDVFSFRSLDKSELDGAKISLYRIDEDGNRELVDTKTNEDGNDVTFPLEFGYKYEIEGRRIGFGPAKESVDLTGPPPRESRLRRDLYFPQLLIVNVFDDATKLPLNGARVQLLRPQGQAGGPYADLTQATNHSFEFGVDLGTPYALLVQRQGYLEVAGDLQFSENDIDDTGKIVFDVYLKQPNLADFLPIELFFDNDYPNPRTRRRTSDKEYLETNIEYYDRKVTFIETFTAPLSEEDAFITRNNYNTFFDLEIRRRRNDLKKFTELLLTQLQAGERYVLTLEGYASPRAKSDYNLILTERRIDCVKNYFEEYQNGVLMPYIEGGDLKFKVDPVGEKEAPKDVSADIKNERESIYSLKASAERRVEITDIQAIN